MKFYQIKNTMTLYIRLCVMLAILVLPVSCVHDEFEGSATSIGGTSFSISVKSSRLLPKQVTSRALSEPKESKEQAINRFYLFFFDQNGDYLKSGVGEDRFYGFQASQQGSSTMNIEWKAIDLTNVEKVIVFAVANVKQGTFTANADGTCKEIENLSQLEAFRYGLREDELSFTLPDEGMPMVGKGSIDVTVPEEQRTNNLIIDLTALMARVDITLKLNSDASDEGELPRLSMMEWELINLPLSTTFTQPVDDSSTSEDEEVTQFDTDWKKNVKSFKQPSNTVIYNKSGEVSLSFYMFENMQLPKSGITYPDGVKDEEKQRYKPNFADEKATYVKVHANYYTYNHEEGADAYYDVTYNLYLGANHTDNFKIKRNSQYKNNVVIKGLVNAGNNSEHVSFDARVNIVEENDYFISILRELDHDAHFCVTPMDIYLFKYADPSVNPTMEVMLPVTANTSDGKPWIRMEKIPSSIMEAGRDTDNDGSSEKWAAGTGKRDYFTTKLLDELSNKGDGTPETGFVQTFTLTHRDRIYFYLDENLSDTEDREVEVTLLYKENGVQVGNPRHLKLRQVHLLPVKVYSRLPNTNQKGDYIHTIYMEQFEEYAQHYDPLDEFNAQTVYKGRTWGPLDTPFGDGRFIPLHNTAEADDLKDVYAGLAGTGRGEKYIDIYDVYYHGLDITPYFCSVYGDMFQTLNEIPSSAVGYCYNKNIRDESGNIPFAYSEPEYGPLVGPKHKYIKITKNEGKWFLPGIRQMEDALTAHYSRFPQFQTDWYWSSAVGVGSGSQDVDRARATKIVNNWYVESSTNNKYEEGKGGSALRDNEFRVRAFRADLEPVNY